MSKKLNHRQICEGELAAAGVDRFVPSFDYSDEEWTEIEQSARLTCNKQLTDEVRQRLRQAGALYLTLSRAGNKFLKQQQLASISSWQSIRRLAGELHEQLDKANVPRVDGSKYGTLLKSLAKLTNDSSISSAKSLQSPRENYYSDVLGVWLDELGGRLGLSRGSNTHKLGGPLVRFFRAVTCPVLKTDAPALETISDIVGRERDRRTATSGRERLKKNREVPLSAVEGPVRPPTLPEIRYTDLGQLQISPGIPIERQVREYVVERGRATGLRHLVAIDGKGRVVLHGCGWRNGILLPETFMALLGDPANKIVIHLNDPFNIGLSNVDISFLVLPGVEAIWWHQGQRCARRTDSRSTSCPNGGYV